MTLTYRVWLKNHKVMVYDSSVSILSYPYGIESVLYKDPNTPDTLTAVNPSDIVLMGMIGREDSEGSLVYEGDIIEGHTHVGPYFKSKVEPKRVVVVWHPETSSFRYWDLALFFGSPQKPHTFLHLPVVVGNIYENPELLPKEDSILDSLFSQSFLEIFPQIKCGEIIRD